MRRREFIAFVGSAAAGWPLFARAQQSTVPVIGFLHSGSPGSFTRHMAAFRQGLGETSYVEGQNVAIEYRWAEGQYDLLPALAADLVSRKVAVIVAGAPPAALAAKASTTAIPIVFGIGYDPVQYGLVASLNRPGGNVTGVVFFAGAPTPKRLQLLHEIVPTASAVGFLVNPNTPTSEGQVSDVRAAAHALGWALHVFNVGREGDFDGVFANVIEQGVAALIVGGDPFFVSSAGTNNRIGGSPFTSGDLRSTRICRGRRPDELWDQPDRCLPPARRLHWPHSQRRKAGGSAGSPANQI